MSGIGFGTLNGRQLDVFADTLFSLGETPERLDYFLQSTNTGTIQDVPTNADLRQIAFRLASHYDKRHELEPIWDAMQEQWPKAPKVLALEARIQALGPAKPADFTNKRSDDALQRMIGNSAFGDPLIFADNIIRTVSTLCQIRSRKITGAPVFGTGFLIGADLLLTAHHVLSDVWSGQVPAEDVTFTFGLVNSIEGVSATMNCRLGDDWRIMAQPHAPSDVDHRVATLPGADELDFALVRLDRPIGLDRGFISLKHMAPRPDGVPANTLVMVMQHPEGQVLRHSQGVVIGQAPPYRLRYNASTKSGASGALVLDEALRPLALHHAGDPYGPLDPVYNQGVPLADIAAILPNIA